MANENNPFRAGHKYHLLADEARERFVSQKKLYDSMPRSQYQTQSLKIYEDLLLYSKSDNWSKYVSYFTGITEEEVQYGIEPASLNRWHELVGEYISSSPTHETISKLILNLGFTPAIASEMVELVEDISYNEYIRQTIEQLYEQFPGLVSTY